MNDPIERIKAEAAGVEHTPGAEPAGDVAHVDQVEGAVGEDLVEDHLVDADARGAVAGDAGGPLETGDARMSFADRLRKLVEPFPKRPRDYAGTMTADAINGGLDKAFAEKDLGADAELGESVGLSLEAMGFKRLAANWPPVAHLIWSLLRFVGGLWKRRRGKKAVESAGVPAPGV